MRLLRAAALLALACTLCDAQSEMYAVSFGFSTSYSITASTTPDFTQSVAILSATGDLGRLYTYFSKFLQQATGPTLGCDYRPMVSSGSGNTSVCQQGH